MVRKDEKGKANDSEKDLVLEEMKELEKELDMQVRECPKCAGFVPPGEDKCHSCGYDMTSAEKEKKDAEADEEPKEAEKPSESEKVGEEDSKDKGESEDDRIVPVLEEMEELISEEEEAEREEPKEREVSEAKIEEEPKRDYGKMISFVVILIGIATYVVTPFVISDSLVAAVALILGAAIIVIGGNMAYSSLQSEMLASEEELETKPTDEVPEEEAEEEETEADEGEDAQVDQSKEEVEQEEVDSQKEEDEEEKSESEEPEPEPRTEETETEPVSEVDSDKITEADKEILQEMKEEPFFKPDKKNEEVEEDSELEDFESVQIEMVEKELAKKGADEGELAEMKDDDSQFVELVPMKDTKAEHHLDTYKCPVCRHSLKAGATECPKCGALFDD
jgi:hypothetical protein